MVCWLLRLAVCEWVLKIQRRDVDGPHIVDIIYMHCWLVGLCTDDGHWRWCWMEPPRLDPHILFRPAPAPRHVLPTFAAFGQSLPSSPIAVCPVWQPRKIAKPVWSGRSTEAAHVGAPPVVLIVNSAAILQESACPFSWPFRTSWPSYDGLQQKVACYTELSPRCRPHRT